MTAPVTWTPEQINALIAGFGNILMYFAAATGFAILLVSYLILVNTPRALRGLVVFCRAGREAYRALEAARRAQSELVYCIANARDAIYTAEQRIALDEIEQTIHPTWRPDK